MKAEGVVFETNADIGKNIPAEKLISEFDAVALCCGAKKARKLLPHEFRESVCQV